MRPYIHIYETRNTGVTYTLESIVLYMYMHYYVKNYSEMLIETTSCHYTPTIGMKVPVLNLEVH